MNSSLEFSLIVPLWNEADNIVELVSLIHASNLHKIGMKELILVNNGSTDRTGPLIDEAACSYPWIFPLHLANNENYGGGVYEGFKHATSDIFCYIPGDLQVMPEDIIKVYKEYSSRKNIEIERLFVKGYRTVRYDLWHTKFVSLVYTWIANVFLGLKIKDVNGLPKMFHRNLINLVPVERMKTFVFDSQLISLARAHNWVLEEIPVTFYGRRAGVSSWSKKRFQIYIQVLRQIIKLRELRHHPGKALERLR